jgi:hypothetical protein
MENRAVRLVKIPLVRDTLKLAPGLTAGMAVGADITTPEPAMIRAIGIGAEMPSRIDGTLAPRLKMMMIGGGDPGALGRESTPCSQASHKGCWIYPVKDLCSFERLRRGLSG